MKTYLMHKEHDFDPEQGLPVNIDDLAQDLGIKIILDAMSQGDKVLFETSRTALLSHLDEIDEILYRQAVLKDCLNNIAIIREIYQIPLVASERKRKSWLGIFTDTPSGILSSAVKLMLAYLDLLKQLRRIADEKADNFHSEGFTKFFLTLQNELDDAFFSEAEFHLNKLLFKNGVLLSASLDRGNLVQDYVLRLPNKKSGSWFNEVFSKRSAEYWFRINERDETGSRILSGIVNKGVDSTAIALGQAADHVENFLKKLQTELAFYVGCINLYEQIKEIENPITFPRPISINKKDQSFKGLYDLCLALTIKKKVIGNDVSLGAKKLTIITGANQGGKSTFLRSIGLSQIMMQAGMFVAAEDFQANLCSGVYTHFRRKEDSSMKSGKLDEELGRMSVIVDQIKPNALILFNESFAATNEREGSEIARQIIQALLERHIKVFYVTHMYELARIFHESKSDDHLFLRAQRNAEGERSFRLLPGEPLPTSFASDIYRRVFQEKSG